MVSRLKEEYLGHKELGILLEVIDISLYLLTLWKLTLQIVSFSYTLQEQGMLHVICISDLDLVWKIGGSFASLSLSDKSKWFKLCHIEADEEESNAVPVPSKPKPEPKRKRAEVRKNYICHSCGAQGHHWIGDCSLYEIYWARGQALKSPIDPTPGDDTDVMSFDDFPCFLYIFCLVLHFECFRFLNVYLTALETADSDSWQILYFGHCWHCITVQITYKSGLWQWRYW